MPREIEEQEYQYLQGRRQVADFVETIWNDPELAADAKALVKRKYPKMSIPDYDLRNEVRETFAAEKKKRDDEEREAKRKTQEDGWKAEREKTQKEYGFTDDAMKDLEKFMVENNVGSYEVAAGYKAAKAPRASEPTSQHGQPWGHTSNETFKQIVADPEAWGRSELMKAARADQDRARQQAY